MITFIGSKRLSEITEPLLKILDVSEEKEPDLKKELEEVCKEKKAVFLAFIAPYVGVKVSPTRTLRAELGLSEEFGVETVINEIKEKTDCSKLCLLLNSPGGLVGSSYKVSRALRKSFDEIIVFVPHIAASGGTLVALTGNEIVMGMMSQLTPLDPTRSTKRGEISAKSVVDGFDTVTQFFKKIRVEDAPYTYKVLADKYDAESLDHAVSVLSLMEGYVSEILTDSGYNEDKANKIAEKLVRGFKSHGEVICLEKAEKTGLKVVSNKKYPEAWNIMRKWLGKYLLQSADKHIIRYVISEDLIKGKTNKTNEANKTNEGKRER